MKEFWFIAFVMAVWAISGILSSYEIANSCDKRGRFITLDGQSLFECRRVVE